MPCNSDHMEANANELASREVCANLAYLLKAMNVAVPEDVQRGAENYYGDVKNADRNTERLCTLCAFLSAERATSIIYDGRNPEARRLADWWDRHKEIDRRKAEPAMSDFDWAAHYRPRIQSAIQRISVPTLRRVAEVIGHELGGG